jgi:hypothetical protein
MFGHEAIVIGDSAGEADALRKARNATRDATNRAKMDLPGDADGDGR